MFKKQLINGLYHPKSEFQIRACYMIVEYERRIEEAWICKRTEGFRMLAPPPI